MLSYLRKVVLCLNLCLEVMIHLLCDDHPHHHHHHSFIYAINCYDLNAITLEKNSNILYLFSF